jgi:hypothetical protein
MEGAGKLVVGLVGVLVGLFAGFGALTLIMQHTGGALFDRPVLGVLVAVGTLGGGATLVGYLALWLTNVIKDRRKEARREARRKKGPRKK